MDLTAFLDVLCRTIRSSLGCAHAAVRLNDGTFYGADDPDAPFTLAMPLADNAGVLCVSDGSARPVTPELRRQLADFAELVSLYLQQASATELFRLVAENCADTLIRGTLDGVRRYVSPSIRALLGYDADELVGKRARDIVHPDDAADFGALMAAMRNGDIDSFTTEHRQRHKDGSWAWLEAFVRVTHDAHRDPDGYIVSVRNTSRRKELESRLVHNASHDALTGLANRALLYERVQDEIERVALSGSGFALLCLDLDGFKQVNDAFGHAAGDIVLAAVADRLRPCVHDADMVARRGGDEFVIVHVTDLPLPESAVELARRLIDAVSRPLEIGGVAVDIGLSVGIVVADSVPLDAESLLRAADAAMYRAKVAGRNGFCVAEDRSTDGDPVSADRDGERPAPPR